MPPVDAFKCNHEGCALVTSVGFMILCITSAPAPDGSFFGKQRCEIIIYCNTVTIAPQNRFLCFIVRFVGWYAGACDIGVFCNCDVVKSKSSLYLSLLW